MFPLPSLSLGFAGGPGGSAGPSGLDSGPENITFSDGSFVVGGTGNAALSPQTSTPTLGGGLLGASGSGISPLLLIGGAVLLLLVLRHHHG